MNTILIIAIVVIIFLLFTRCKLTCSQVSGYTPKKPKNVCNMIGMGPDTGEIWTQEQLREAKASCTLYESICGPASTWTMAWPIIYNPKSATQKTTRFELAAKSVVSGGPKECAAPYKCTTCPSPSTCVADKNSESRQGTCQFH